MKNPDKDTSNQKLDELEQHREHAEDARLSTNQGLLVTHTDDSLKAGPRGPTLLEDFNLREKMMHFDHERIPERVVHARGSAAHGYFQCYENFSDLTRAGLLCDPSRKTPVFVRFSTVVGFRGSADTVRDVRGFATKFYTEEGVWDLVANNMPVFFIQDGIKFPDLVHSIKPEPHHEMPQASAAHDNFWDFISLMPESMHMIMWVLSDRALPRSYSRMEGFGVHTFRFINEQGKARFVKFHWKPTRSIDSLVWDETQKIAGKDPDFNRRDLWEMIERGDYPEFELGVQIVEEEDEHKFDFDLLDPTKLIPEEDVPVKKLGKMVLNRNPDNFFAETEQVAFHPGHVVPGIDFTNDPLLQGRLFSYLDTQITRLGGPNFAEIPINRPTCPVHNNQRDGFMRQTINTGKSPYSPNNRAKGCPMLTPEGMGGYAHYMERIEGQKVRERSESFKDHYTQAAMFYRSLSDSERRHLISAGQFELGKVADPDIRTRVLEHFAHIDTELAKGVAEGVGVPVPDGEPVGKVRTSAALSMENEENRSKRSAMGCKIAAMIAEGFDDKVLKAMMNAAEKQGAVVEIVAPRLGEIKGAGGSTEKADKTFATTHSVLYDAFFMPGGDGAVKTLRSKQEAAGFFMDAYAHAKPIALAGVALDAMDRWLPGLEASPNDSGITTEHGVVLQRKGKESELADAFLEAVGEHRHWGRDHADS
ncbi:MAG: catalase [Phycisphaerales bacterium]